MDGPTGQAPQRTLTPAVLASALFVAASAIFAIVFAAGRGGLEMPVASRDPVAVASPAPPGSSPDPGASPTTPNPAPTPGPPSAPPTVPPSTAAPPSVPPASLDPNDPLLALPECPDRPGCFVYVVQPSDTLPGVVGRYALSLAVVLALNPELEDPSVIERGSTLYLARDPFVRLDPCPDEPACSLYVVEAGDSVAEIAATYGLPAERIRDQNPDMPRPLEAGQVIELPHPE